MLPMPLARRRAMSDSVMARVCKPADGRTLLVHERLHAQAHAIDAAAEQRFQNLVGDGAGRALDGDLGCGLDVEVVADRPKQAFQLVRREHRRRAAAEVDRIHAAFEIATELLRNTLGSFNLRAHLLDVPVKQRARKYSRGKVAEAALGAAERYRDVNSL